jgi:hypothetical protein
VHVGSAALRADGEPPLRWAAVEVHEIEEISGEEVGSDIVLTHLFADGHCLKRGLEEVQGQVVTRRAHVLQEVPQLHGEAVAVLVLAHLEQTVLVLAGGEALHGPRAHRPVLGHARDQTRLQRALEELLEGVVAHGLVVEARDGAEAVEGGDEGLAGGLALESTRGAVLRQLLERAGGEDDLGVLGGECGQRRAVCGCHDAVRGRGEVELGATVVAGLSGAGGEERSGLDVGCPGYEGVAEAREALGVAEAGPVLGGPVRLAAALDRVHLGIDILL